MKDKIINVIEKDMKAINEMMYQIMDAPEYDPGKYVEVVGMHQALLRKIANIIEQEE